MVVTLERLRPCADLCLEACHLLEQLPVSSVGVYVLELGPLWLTWAQFEMRVDLGKFSKYH